MERSERLVVGCRDVFGAAAVLEPGVLRSDTRVIEPGGDRMRLGDLAVRVLQQVRAVAVQYPRLSGAQRRGVSSGGQALARGLDADELYFFILDVRVKNPHGVRSAADAGDQRVGLPPGELGHLREAFLAD